MNKWELARYVIDAKKCIDSLIYIDKYLDQLRHLEIREQVSLLCDRFYIRCCVVLDKTINKKEICATDDIVKTLYYERDKNSAHKDESYKGKNYTIKEQINNMKTQLQHVVTLCKDNLPDVLTLNYVPYDKILFRLVNNLSSYDIEEVIKKKKFTNYGKLPEGVPFKEVKAFNDTEEIRHIDENERSQYGVICECGLNMYEGLQNRQDFCIKVNVLFNLNMWVSFNEETVKIFERLRKIGFIDIFDMIKSK